MPVAKVVLSKNKKTDSERWVKDIFPKATKFWLLTHQNRHKHVDLYAEADETAPALNVCVFKCLVTLANEFQRIRPFSLK